MLVRKRFGGLMSDSKKHISNLSDYSLSETETFVLGNGSGEAGLRTLVMLCMEDKADGGLGA